MNTSGIGSVPRLALLSVGLKCHCPGQPLAGPESQNSGSHLIRINPPISTLNLICAMGGDAPPFNPLGRFCFAGGSLGDLQN